ncbi:MAG: nicotinate-nucleotide diphosphorylase (carboxylating) [Omnitrophica bacterium GWA2_41_15]|nr:MAG: nicotinate-nucleotide diphosphorylase (carboxylating) [Omnitrophica bacterium GWA2_41_15]HAZ10936.1 carboxylating nicotinate-nucleotide diphosphorylase [Candidatus Omnitrophota bacterium]
MKLTKEKVFPIIISALKEDIGSGDITSSVIFEKPVSLLAHIIVKEECILAGADVVKWVFDAVDEKIAFTALYKDGDRVKKNKRIISVRGSAKNILSAERTVLNFLGHLSGVATLTAEFVKEVKGTGARIYDTRKTTPGLREMEKYAVVAGGGFNFRIGLWDEVMIKDNHLGALREDAIKKSVSIFKSRGYKNIEVEVDDIAEFKEALEAEADIIMLDNMKAEEIKKAVKLKDTKDKGRFRQVILEASGGVSLENVRKIAKTGVDRISIGKLTHSAPSIDFSLEICQNFN